MRTLPYTLNRDTGIPSIDEIGFVRVTARVTMKGGRELYLCDDFAEIAAAVAGDDRFVAHRVEGNKPIDTVINPSAVATAEKLDS